MSSKTINRDKNIYYFHKTYRKDEDIAKRYGLKLATIKKIIKKMDEKAKERDQFIDELRDYTQLNYTNLKASFIYNSLKRYLIANEIHSKIFTKDDLIETIKTNHIRGIGDRLRPIIEEFIESTN